MNLLSRQHSYDYAIKLLIVHTGLQSHYDIEMARDTMGETLKHIEQHPTAA